MPDRSIAAKLLATAAVTGKLGTATAVRCGDHLDASDVLPSILVKRAGKRPMNVAGGVDASGTVFADVIVECIATTYAAAVPLTDAAEEVLNGYTNTGGTPPISMVHVQNVSYDPGSRLPGRDGIYEVFRLDCLVQYSE